MAQVLSSTAFLEAFKGEEADPWVELPSWLKDAREEDVRFLKLVELPSFKSEEWKYSPLASLWKQSFARVSRMEGVFPDELRHFLINGALNVTVFNGHILGDEASLSGLPKGLSLIAGKAAFNVLQDSRHFNLVTPNDPELFLRLNRAFFSDPLVITAERGVKVEPLVHIIHVVTTSLAAVFPRVFIRAGEGASVNVLQTFVSLPRIPYLSVPATDIVLEEGAIVEYGEKHHHSSAASHIGMARVWQAKDSRFRSFVSTTGAELFRSNLSVMLEGHGASATINGLHALKDEVHADSHTFLEHLAPNTSSDQLYKCVLQDVSRSVFNGRVFVHRDAQQTNSYQLNKNLLLSSECRVDTKPQLEIKADDVKCTHGATIGQLDEDQLFYLQTRAIGRNDAVRMLVRGFMDDVLSRVEQPLMREAFSKV